jgi:transcriptional regulator with XRE-family HTH domain
MLDELGKAIRERRKFLKLTQESLSKRCRVSKSTISKLERNRYTDLGIRRIDKICSALKLRITAGGAEKADFAGVDGGKCRK